MLCVNNVETENSPASQNAFHESTKFIYDKVIYLVKHTHVYIVVSTRINDCIYIYIYMCVCVCVCVFD
jgi:hypothetical protein